MDSINKGIKNAHYDAMYLSLFVAFLGILIAVLFYYFKILDFSFSCIVQPNFIISLISHFIYFLIRNLQKYCPYIPELLLESSWIDFQAF